MARRAKIAAAAMSRPWKATWAESAQVTESKGFNSRARAMAAIASACRPRCESTCPRVRCAVPSLGSSSTARRRAVSAAGQSQPSSQRSYPYAIWASGNDGSIATARRPASCASPATAAGGASPLIVLAA